MQKIRIDFDNPGLPQHISAVENDSQSRFFQATLYENGKSYTAPEGATYSIMYRGFGPQNQGWYDTINDGAGKRAACAVSGNVVTCEIARQALQVPGHVSIVLCVTTGKGYMLKSWPIECDCKNDRYDSTAEIQSFFYITQVSNADWTQAIQAWENLKDTIDPTLSLSGKAADAAKVGEAVNAEAERAKGVESQIKEDIGHHGIIRDLNITWNEGYYGYNGAFNNDTGFHSEKILLLPNDKIVFNGVGYLDRVAIISEWNGDKAITIPLVISKKDETKYEYIADKYLEIILSSVNKDNAIIVRGSNNFRKEKITIEQGYYIAYNGMANHDDAYYTSGIIHLNSGDMICFMDGGLKTNVAVLSKVDYSNGELIPLLYSSNRVACYSYKADESMDVIVSGNVEEKEIYISMAIKNDECIPDYTKLMKKVGAIGDSLISGVVYDGDVGKHCFDYSWIGNIFKSLGNEVLYFSHGGYGVKTWFDNKYDEKLTKAEMCDIYFINFGTNDIWRKEYKLGWSSDAVGANTFCGWYKKLIEFIHSYNSNAKIFCMGLYDAKSESLKYDIQIKEITKLYDYCYFCNTLVATTVKTTMDDDNLISNFHPTAIGYLIIGDDFKRFINNVVDANKTDFKLCGFYKYSG